LFLAHKFGRVEEILQPTDLEPLGDLSFERGAVKLSFAGLGW